MTTEYMTRAEIWLIITIMAYLLMNGAQIFETFVLVPQWTAAPPASLHFFRGPHGIDLKTFWIAAHSVHEITFILAVIFCWKLDVRIPLLLLLAMHIAVRAWTLIYFAPSVIEFSSFANGAVAPADLLSRTNLWRCLNYFRVAIFLLVNAGLIVVLFRVMQWNRSISTLDP